jgi:hypothetical protein
MDHLARQFERMGARVQVGFLTLGQLRIDVKADRDSEYFEVLRNPSTVRDLLVVDADAKDRHLLLLAKTTDEQGAVRNQRFLCGHDERAWFVASIPGVASNVRQAKEALKPWVIRTLQDQLRVRPKDRNRRKNAAFVRQGEWFFIPQPNLRMKDFQALRNEPIQRGAGKPHLCEFLVRTGGETVYVARGYPKTLTSAQHSRLLKQKRHLRKLPWVPMRRDMNVFVMGRIRHPDHKTVVLRCWHQVVSNTEGQAEGAPSVAFLD